MLGRLITAKECTIYTLWRPIRVAIDDPFCVKETWCKGAKAPRRRRQRRRKTSRGKRGGRSAHKRQGERLGRQQIPSTPNHQRRPAVVKAGSGSRFSHFQRSFDKSVQLGTVLAKQIMDIKNRANQRALIGRVPLPPRAADGLRSRQHRVVAMSRRWGDCYAAVMKMPRSDGRVFWRQRVFREAYSTHGEVEARRTHREVFPDVSEASTSQTMVWGEPRDTREPIERRPMVRFCIVCGERHFSDQRTCIVCIERAARQRAAKAKAPPRGRKPHRGSRGVR